MKTHLKTVEEPVPEMHILNILQTVDCVQHNIGILINMPVLLDTVHYHGVVLK
jgi:hypothetical protein